jgi:hypothetical protein
LPKIIKYFIIDRFETITNIKFENIKAIQIKLQIKQKKFYWSWEDLKSIQQKADDI